MRRWYLGLLMGVSLAAHAQDPNVVVVGLMSDRAILKVDGEQVLLHVGDSHEGVSLVSVSAHEAVLSINGHERHFGLGADVGGMSKYVAKSLDIPINAAGQFIVDGQINGQGVSFLVDTGATLVSMSAYQARELGIRFESGHAMVAQTAGGAVRCWSIKLDTIKVGPLVEHNVDAVVLDTPAKTPVLLGMTFLNRIELRQEKDRLHLTAR